MVKQKGFTLVELMVVAILIGVLSGLAVPAFNRLYGMYKARSAVNQLWQAVTLTRNAAIASNHIATLCKSANGLRCGGNWNDGQIVFIDHNANGQVDGKDIVVRRLTPLHSDEKLYWNSFQNKGYLQMSPDGSTNNMNGTFRYCPKYFTKFNARALIINKSGRPRFSRDSNGDGVFEELPSMSITCPQ